GGAVGVVAERGERVDRGDVDDRAGAPRDHVPQDFATTQERARQRDVEVAAPDLEGHLGECLVAGDEGAVDEDVDVSEGVARSGDHGAHVVLAADVGGHGQSALAGGAGGPFGGCRVDVGDDHGRALGGEAAGE